MAPAFKLGNDFTLPCNADFGESYTLFGSGYRLL